MFVRVPKIRKNDGKMVMTTIQPKDAIGFEDTVLHYGGKAYAGCKIYSQNGSFKVFASATEVAGALMLALKTGEVVELALGGTGAAALKPAQPKMQEVHKIQGVKVVTSGGWVAAAGWGQKKLGSGK
jgi:hypothetical protein